MFKRLSNNIASLLIIAFSASLSLGTLNPFMSSDSEESSIGIAQLITIILLPYLFIKYGGRIKRRLDYNRWIRPLVVFFVLAFFTSFVLAQSHSVGFFIYWSKLLVAIVLCIVLPVAFRDEKLINLSILAFSLSSVLLSVLVLTGLMNGYAEVINGRLYLWGENPNSSSTRWAAAILFLIYITLKNPFGLKAYRYFLIIGILPLIVLIFMSGSRGSLIIAFLCVVIYFFRYTKANLFKIVLYSAIIAIPLLFVFTKYVNLDDFATIDRLQDSVDQGGNEIRTQLLIGALQIFADSPIYGVGNTNFMNLMTTRFQFENTVHNLYAYILAISGLCGFLPFSVFLWRMIKGCWIVRKVDIFPGLLLFFICFIASKTGGILCYLLMWYIYALILSYVNNEYKKLPPPQPKK